MSQIIKLLESDLVSLTGDTGGAITASVAGTINIKGVGSVSVDGTLATNLLEISLAGTIPEQFDTNVGSAIPAGGILNIGGGTNLNTSGATNIVTINLDDIITLTAVTATNVFATDITVSGLSRGIVQSSAAGLLSSSEGTDGQILVSSSTGAPAFANISSTGGYLDITNGANTIDIDLNDNTKYTAIKSWTGTFLDDVRGVVSSDGTTVIVSIDKAGGGDLDVNFTDGFYVWDTTPAATVNLTVGSNTSPTLNRVYFDQPTKSLITTTGSWPATEHARIGEILVPSAAFVQTDDVYMLHSMSDEAYSASKNSGHIEHIGNWIRHQHATWIDGVSPTLTITVNGAAKDNVIFTSTAGNILQTHEHSFPAFTGTPDLYVSNDSVTAYKQITDINEINKDSDGSTLVNKYFTLVIWGVSSGNGTSEKLFINLPSGSYSSANYAKKDTRKETNYSIPDDFKGAAFLIASYVLHYDSADSGTWTNEQYNDLRGLYPTITAGGSTSETTEFADNAFKIYDEGDVTKILDFQVSGITTGNTRTITVGDFDLDFSLVGTANQILTSNGAGSAPTFQDAPAGTTYASDAETIAGTETAKAVAPSNLKAKLGAQTSHGIAYGAGTAAAVAWTAEMSDGQLLIGDTGGVPIPATLTGEHGIEITNAAGSIKVGNLLTINNQTGTSYTTLIGDQNKFITMTNASASTLTIPPESSVAYDIGCTIYVQQLGAGQVTLTPGTGVTFKSADDAYKLVGQNSGAALVKTDNDQWSIFGDTEA